MASTDVSSFDHLLDLIKALAPEEQDALIEVVSRRRAEQRRNEIAHSASETLDAVRDGRAQYGTVEDLKRDLLPEP